MTVQRYTGTMGLVSRRNSGARKMKLKIKIKAKYFFFQKEYIPGVVSISKKQKSTKPTPFFTWLRPVLQN